MSASAANPWLSAMGLPQWQLRDGSGRNAESISDSRAAAEAPAVLVQSPTVVDLKMMEPIVGESTPVNAMGSGVQPLTDNQVAESVTADAAEQFKEVPLLVVWDELQEQAVAGAGSMPSGELGDLLANIVLAVGLTEDVIEAWSMPPDDIGALLVQKQLAPRGLWFFSLGNAVQHQTLKIGAGQHTVQMISAPSLRELQAQKPLKAQLWRVLKPLADAGLWR